MKDDRQKVKDIQCLNGNTQDKQMIFTGDLLHDT